MFHHSYYQLHMVCYSIEYSILLPFLNCNGLNGIETVLFCTNDNNKMFSPIAVTSAIISYVLLFTETTSISSPDENNVEVGDSLIQG